MKVFVFSKEQANWDSVLVVTTVLLTPTFLPTTLFFRNVTQVIGKRLVHIVIWKEILFRNIMAMPFYKEDEN
jgi:hypothetical protein